jgi:hypothetical protein
MKKTLLTTLLMCAVANASESTAPSPLEGVPVRNGLKKPLQLSISEIELDKMERKTPVFSNLDEELPKMLVFTPTIPPLELSKLGTPTDVSPLRSRIN